ncbi:hypothetical protein ACFY64_31565 [Streptomyces collinus]|uniref:hypothetical protein n=1 Tax=Streptomyces collinus TaxID=42684 RepID=UPI0036AFAC21
MPLLELTPEQTEALRQHLERAADMWRRMLDAFRAMARQLVRAATAMAEFVQSHQSAPARAAGDRPAWMSPYGPPTGRHRRR